MSDADIPASWKWAKLKDIGPIISGGTPKTSEPSNFKGKIPWITPADLTNYTSKTISKGRRNITESGLNSSSAKIIPKNSVIFSTRAPIGYVVIAANELATNQGFKSVIVNEYTDASFVYYYLKSAKHLAEENASGTTFKEISGSRFAQLPIPVAPFKEQHRIVEKIETLFARLDKGEAELRSVQTLLARYRQSVLKAAVTGQLTADGRTKFLRVKLGELLEDLRYGTATKCTPERIGTAVLRIPNVAGGKISLRDLKFGELTETEIEKLSLRLGDLLLVRSNGSANLVGRGAVVSEEAVGFSFAGYLIRLRLDKTRLLPEFLFFVLSSPVVREKIERQARSTSGVHNINSAEVRAIEFDLPPINTQQKIVEILTEHFSKIDALEEWCETELMRSSALRQSILKDAFSGRLVPQDPSDEPATTLLARIKGARTDAPKNQKSRMGAKGKAT